MPNVADNKRCLMTLRFLLTSWLFLIGQYAFCNEPANDSTVVIINKIVIAGNATTKEKVILRELLFTEGDTINKTNLNELLVKTKENLFNTSLFNFITINTIENDPIHSSIFIYVEERWYLWPYPIFEQADRNLSAFFHDKDWSRLNYGIMLTKYNFRGRRETLKIKLRFGYKEQLQFYYSNPYLFKNKKHGLAAEFSWYRQHEASVNTINDQLYYYKDSIDYAQKFHTSFLTYQYRKEYYTKHNITLAFTHINIKDTISKINPNYLGDTLNKADFFTLNYTFDIDKRNYQYYPLKGYNLTTQIEQKGFGIFDQTIQNVTSLKIESYKYFQFSNRWYTGIGGKLKISSNKDQAFFIQEALGYKDYLRAYEYYVIDGQQFITGHTFMKFAIIPLNIQQIESWGWKKFNKINYSLYINVFFDAGYVKNNYNTSSNALPNSFLCSTGIGIDLVTYYDKILRLEYSINKQKQSGVFIHIGKAF